MAQIMEAAHGQSTAGPMARIRSARRLVLPVLLAGAALLGTGCGGGGNPISMTGSGSSGGSTTYTLAGVVTLANGDYLQNVSMALSGTTTTTSTPVTATTATGTYGAYAFTVSAGTYTITPTLSGYTFSPASLPKVVSADVSNANFTATATSSGASTPPSPAAQ